MRHPQDFMILPSATADTSPSPIRPLAASPIRVYMTESTITLIPPDRLQPATLRSLIEEFVTRDGTRYGHREPTMEEMVGAVQRQFRMGEVLIVFDEDSETCTILTKAEYSRRMTTQEHVPEGE